MTTRTTDETETPETDALSDEAQVTDAIEELHDDVRDDALESDVVYVDEEVEDRQGSLAARLLSWLVLLIVGGGVALWLAPEVAPRLPAWAEPARQFLMPGETVVEREVAELRNEVSTTIEGLPLGTDEAAVAALVAKSTDPLRADLDGVAAKVTDLGSQVSTDMTALGDRINSMDSGDIEARLATLETEFSGVRAELKALTDALVSAGDSGISEETIAQLDANASKIDGLRAEVQSLAQSNGQLSQRIDEVEVKATRQIEEANREVEVAEAEIESAEEAARAAAEENMFNERFAALSAAAMGGVPFAGELEALNSLGRVEVPAALVAAAPSGIASVAKLDAELVPLAHEAIRESMRAAATEDGGTMSKIGAFFASQVATRSLSATDGDDPDAVLSRISDSLKSDDLDTVLEEAKALPDAATGVLSTWLDKVTLRRDVLEAVSNLGSGAS